MVRSVDSILSELKMIMKVIVICSGTRGIISPFIIEQMDSLKAMGIVEFRLFAIRKRGWFGYLSHFIPVLNLIKQFKPDFIHAHYGLSGLLANMQRMIPVITTFHGSDANNKKILKWSRIANRFSAASIFVEESMKQKFRNHSNSFVIPCGVDLSTFYPMSRSVARRLLNIEPDNIIVLFYSGFDNPVKNYPLAKTACNLAENKLEKKVNLLELKGLSRAQVNLYLNAADCLLLYSSSEGSPQLIKEAMACNCPVVSTDVGDVKWIVGETKGCYITSFKIAEVAGKLISALEFVNSDGCTNGRDRIIALGLDSVSIALKLKEVYNKVSKTN